MLGYRRSFDRLAKNVIALETERCSYVTQGCNFDN
jgi:hypothetical protein